MCIAESWWGATYAHGLEKVLGLLVDIEHAALGVLGEVESRDLGDVLVLALTLLLLKLEGDTTDGATLNALHEVSGVAGNLEEWLLIELSHVFQIMQRCIPCCAGAWRR